MVQDTSTHTAAHADVAALQAELRALRAELAELQRRDAHLRAAMQASNVVAYRWDIATDRITRLRSTSEPGRTLEDAGSFDDVVAKVLQEDQPVFRADIAAALASADGLYRTELRYRQPDGVVRWVSESGRVLQDEQGRPATLVGVTFDITDRKLAEQALRQAEARLREQDQRKDRFLAVLAHELRNPLAPIRNAVQILRRGGGTAVDIGRPCDIIERQVGQLVRLVDDLLDVSRISSGKVVLQREPVDLRDVVRQGLETSQDALGARRHTVQLAVPEHPVPVLGDAARLAQVITNLLNNAAKYTDPGGRVVLSLSLDGADALVSVRDNGHGLDPSEQQRVFEPFFQVATDLERSQGGLGLGLSLVRDLVELHGGRVEAHSEGRGRGSCFCVRLPLAHGVAARPSDPPDQHTAPGDAHTARGALRVLVVDDLPDAAESLAALLQLQGHAVVLAHDGRTAVEAALRERPDLVLLDIALPGLSGHEACRAMRDAGLHGAMIVALSGHGQAEALAESRRAGFDEHLVKPVDWPALQAVLARCVRGLARTITE